MKHEDELLALLLGVKETLTTSGAFESFDCAPEDCGLPYVYGKLNIAIELLNESKVGQYKINRIH